MDAYISEAQVMSCDVVDMLHIDILQKDIIQPGHKTICCAKVSIDIKGQSPRIIKAIRFLRISVNSSREFIRED